MRRFDAASYVTLCRTMLDFDLRDSLGAVRALTSVAGITSDRLFPLAEQQVLADGIPAADTVRVVRSDFGHDGFLIEAPQVDTLLADLLARAPR